MYRHVWSSILQFYDYFVTHITPGPQSTSYFVAMLLLPTSLLIPPSTLSHKQLCGLFLPLIYACQLHSFIQMRAVDVLGVDLALWSFNFLAFRDPRRTFKRVRMKEKSEEAYPSKLSSRISWVLTLMVSFRYSTWKIGEPSHDRTQPPKTLDRAVYLKHAFRTVAQSYFLFDLASSYVQTDPYFKYPMGIDAAFPNPTVATPRILALLRRLPPRFVRASTIAAQLYSAVSLTFALPTMLAVALHVIGVLPVLEEWSPHNWPLFFGSFSVVSRQGLRGLWGSWWHQTNRQLTSTPGRALNGFLGIPTSSAMGYTSLVVSAFFFSGVTHMGLVPPEPLRTTVSANTMRCYIGAFFWAQIPGFGIELVGERVFRKIFFKPPQPIIETLVLSWTIAWLCLTLPLLGVPFRELGYWEGYPVPISPIRGLLGNGWTTW